MHYRTKFSLGDRIYAIDHSGCWSVLGVKTMRSVEPLTIEGVMILPGEDGQRYSVFYSVRELPGDLLPEERCHTDLRKAGLRALALNGRQRVPLDGPGRSALPGGDR